jgi:hypothetical protein
MRRVGACSKVKPSWSANDTQVSLTTGELQFQNGSQALEKKEKFGAIRGLQQ